MKILVTDIKYKEKTQEWKVDINALAGYKQYIDEPKADHSIWRFGDFMNFNNQLPTSINLDVPYDSLVENIDAIEAYVKKVLHEKTSRDIESFKITYRQ